MIYGKKITEKEFLLRHLTTLSYNIYILISLTLKLNGMKDNNREKILLEKCIDFHTNKALYLIKSNPGFNNKKFEENGSWWF